MLKTDIMYRVKLYKGDEEVCKNGYVWIDRSSAVRYANEKKGTFKADRVEIFEVIIGDPDKSVANKIRELIQELAGEDTY